MNATVVIATYNERENLGGLVCVPFSSARAISIIVVDDNSPDGTGAMADDLAATPRTGGSRSSIGQGQRGLGRSLVAGLQRALSDGADLIFQMDADFSHDPKYLPDMAAAAADADLVLGSRYLHGVSVVNWPLHRIILSSLANRYIRAVTGLDVQRLHDGLPMLEARGARAAPARRPDLRWIRVPHRAAAPGETNRLPGAEVPIIFVERREGSSKISSNVLLESAIVPWRLRLKP